MENKEMSEMEIKAKLFDLDQEIKLRQQSIQQLVNLLIDKQKEQVEKNKDDKQEDIHKDN